MNCMARTTVSMPQELLDRIDAEISGTEGRSGWLRDAARQRLNRENAESSGPEPEAGAA